MIVKSIEVRNFRKFMKPVAINEIDPGLTVIVGDNEEGKSTLLDALRTVLFVRHNITGDVATALLPYNSSVRPVIKLSFELHGKNYRLSKAFCQHPEAELSGPDGNWSGPVVEEKLQELLKFKPPGRGGGDDRHRGIWGLFWVEQGRSFRALDPNDDSRSAIRATLESEVGDVLGGKRGSKILASITRQYEKTFTTGGKPTGDYARAIKEKEPLESELTDVRNRLVSYEGKVGDLQAKLDRLSKYKSEKILEKAREALASAQEVSRKIEQLEKERNKCLADQRVAQAECETASVAWKKRKEEIQGIESATSAVKSFTEQLTELRPTISELESNLARFTSARNEAETTLSKVQAQLVRVEQEVRHARAKAVIGELKERLGKARRANEKEKDFGAQAKAILLDARALAGMKKLDKEAEDARVMLEGVATGLKIITRSGKTATLDGVKLPAEASRRITDVAEIEIKDVCQITVTPGGDLDQLRDAQRKTAQKLGDTLSRYGVKNLAEGEGQVEERKRLLGEAETQAGLVSVHAPDGLEALEAELSLQEAILKDLSAEQRKHLPPVSDAENRLEDLRSTREKEQKEFRVVAAQEAEVRAQLAEVQQKTSRLEGELKQSQEHFTQAKEQLDSNRRKKADEVLEKEYEAAITKEESARIVARRLEQEWEDAQPEKTQLRLQQAGKAVMEIERDQDTANQGIRDLQTELRTLGQIGLGEREEELAAKLDVANRESERLEREARAIKLLHQVLTQAEKEAKETFLSPVTKRVEPYLRMLLPEAELVLDENIEITGLRRGAVLESFQDLSLGTREQLAVLARLAFADLLREKGQPAAVILDDAIVYADEERFQNMLLILAKAATNLQVIVLTCHERDYLSSGARIIRLAECRLQDSTV
ncbi:MAG: AAA family ATPase [Acidobacteriia bacterium]|nr:AAA family ATPase [Terriglobia bacterium]